MILYLILLFVFIYLFLFKNFNGVGFNKNEIKEGFNNDYSDYTTIDRIKVNDNYAYCIGGKATCLTGVPVLNGTYKGGTTYESYCDDMSNMVCNNIINTQNLDLDVSGDNYIWTTPNNIKILFSKLFKGFTSLSSYLPVNMINNDYVFYDENLNILDTINKCDLLGIDTNKCKNALKIPYTINTNQTHRPYDNSYIVYSDSSNGDISYNTTINTSDIGQYNQTIETKIVSKGEKGMYPNLPCVADFGSAPGDNVCNGEIGLIQDETLICPYYKPICNGYKCDSTFGKCVYKS